jgi:hypothetical protein
MEFRVDVVRMFYGFPEVWLTVQQNGNLLKAVGEVRYIGMKGWCRIMQSGQGGLV